MKNHLAHTRKDVKPCLKVLEEVKNYFEKQKDELQKIGSDNTKREPWIRM